MSGSSSYIFSEVSEEGEEEEKVEKVSQGQKDLTFQPCFLFQCQANCAMERYTGWEVETLQGGEEEPLLEVDEELLLEEEEGRRLVGDLWNTRYEPEQGSGRLCAVDVLPRDQLLDVLPRGQLCERLPLVPKYGIWQSCF